MDSTGCLLDAVSIFVDHLGRMNESINYQNGRPRACGFVGYVGAVPVWKNAPVRVRARARAGMWQYACAEDRGLETRCYSFTNYSTHTFMCWSRASPHAHQVLSLTSWKACSARQKHVLLPDLTGPSPYVRRRNRVKRTCHRGV